MTILMSKEELKRALEFYFNNCKFREGMEITVDNVYLASDVCTVEVKNG